jgi:hypothetical protein
MTVTFDLIAERADLLVGAELVGGELVVNTSGTNAVRLLRLVGFPVADPYNEYQDLDPAVLLNRIKGARLTAEVRMDPMLRRRLDELERLALRGQHCGYKVTYG